MYKFDRGIYRSKEYLQIIDEHMDLEDKETRHICMSINEEDQNRLLASLTSKLYDNIVEKVDDIDFGDLPRTKGDFTKLPNYDKVVGCVDTLRNILIQYKQKTDPVDVISTAIENLRLKKDLFEKGFRYNVELPMLVYNTVGLSVISAISLLISTTIEFIKSPNQDGYHITLDQVALVKTKDHLLFDNLKKFNEACRKGDLDKSIDFVIKSNAKGFTGMEYGMIAGGIALVAIILNIVPILRELVFFFYYTRTRVSDYFDVQADLLQMNAHNLEMNNNHDLKDKERIIKQQLRIADVFRRIANAIAVNSKQAEVAATKEIVNADKKIKTSEILDSAPDSAAAASSSALF